MLLRKNGVVIFEVLINVAKQIEYSEHWQIYLYMKRILEGKKGNSEIQTILSWGKHLTRIEHCDVTDEEGELAAEINCGDGCSTTSDCAFHRVGEADVDGFVSQ